MGSAVMSAGRHVAAGKDCSGEHAMSIWVLIPLSTKVLTSDTNGGWFLFEHRDMPKGGPPRHIHHGQDEWFYVVKGCYAMEVGDSRYELKPGDSLLAPRGVPHAWACVSDDPGTILTAVSPAGTFEQFIRETTKHPTLPSPAEIEKAFAAHDMTVVGPPLSVD
jgi:quercetin dioxygenase-like cupin family protein